MRKDASFRATRSRLSMKRLFLTGIAALFLATGAAHARPQVIAGKPKVVVTHFRISTLPPAKYDVPYEGQLEIFYYQNLETAGICDPGALACARPTSDHKRCVISILSPEAAKRLGINYAFSLRHELGHCNGWKHPKESKKFQEGEIWKEAEGAKWIREATHVEMPKLPPSTRTLHMATSPVVCLTPDWKEEPCSERKYKDEPNAWAKPVREVPYVNIKKTP